MLVTTQDIRWLGTPVRAWFLALVVAMWGVTLLGMNLQHLLKLSPCPMCIFQRFLFMVMGGIALLGGLFPRLANLWAAFIAGGGLLGLGVSGYQSWMQAFPDLAKECSYTDPSLLEQFVEYLGMNWPDWFLATGFCTSREWELLGLSMANWAFGFFCIVLGVMLVFISGRKQ